MKTHSAIKLLCIAITAVMIASCTQTLYTSVDVLRPAKVVFGKNINHIILLNNTVAQPPGDGHKLEQLNQKVKNVALNTDSVALFCLGALTNELNAKAFFKSVRLKKESQNCSDNFLRATPLELDTVKAICATYNADAAIILDKIKVDDIIAEYYEPEENAFAGVFEVRYETDWSIVEANTGHSARIRYRDTIYWENPSYNLKIAMNGLPRRIDGVIDGALHAGRKTANRLTPYWEKEDRYFFRSRNKYIRSGIDSIYIKQWDAAARMWEMALRSSSPGTRAFAANNIAVVMEINGDIDKAIQYQQRAIKDYPGSTFMNQQYYYLMVNYLNELKARQTETELLNKQTGKE